MSKAVGGGLADDDDEAWGASAAAEEEGGAYRELLRLGLLAAVEPGGASAGPMRLPPAASCRATILCSMDWEGAPEGLAKEPTVGEAEEEEAAAAAAASAAAEEEATSS